MRGRKPKRPRRKIKRRRQSWKLQKRDNDNWIKIGKRQQISLRQPRRNWLNHKKLQRRQMKPESKLSKMQRRQRQERRQL